MADPLTLGNGQQISTSDPNYATYKKQSVLPSTPAPADQIPTPSTINIATPDLTKLNAGNLTPTPSISYSVPNPTPIYPVDGLDTTTGQVVQTAPEQKVSDLSTRIQELNDSLIGKSAYKAQQEANQGLPDLLKTQTDLSAKLKAVQNEAQAIPLQLQNEATGRGMTAGGLAPLQTARLRTNAIQALGVSSLLEASKGNIATAQDLVDRAVAQKYDPINEEIAAKTANLNIILQSPEYTVAEKNRAQAQLDYQNKKKTANDKAAQDSKDIMTTATEAAKNGADALTLQKISQAKTPAEALTLAGPYLAAKFNSDQKQLDFENSLKTGQFNLDKQALEEKIKQQAFDNNVSLENLKLDRAKFASDAEYKNASLVLDKMKIEASLVPGKKDIVKINGVDYQVNPDGTYTKPNVPEEQKQATETQNQAASSAQELLNKLIAGTGTSAVGGTRIFGMQLIPGSSAKDFEIQFNNLKSLLSLDNVKLLKGQGQVSDAERRLLSEASAKLDLNQSQSEFKKSLQDITVVLGAPGGLQIKDDGTYTYKNIDGTVHKGKQGDNYHDTTKPPPPSFSQVGGDTNIAVTQKLTKLDDGSKGGQCGRFVNKLTGLGVGDSYKSKLAKMDPSIKTPEPGMVFTMPYKDTGHVGFIVGIDGNKAIVKDSNYGLDGTIKTHTIPISKMTGFARV